MSDENEDQEPELVEVPVDEPEPLTGRHREFVRTDPLAAQHWDRRNWRRS